MIVMPMDEEIVVISAVRTAIGKFGKSLKDIPARRLGAMAIAVAMIIEL